VFNICKRILKVMFLEEQIIILEWLLKNHVTLTFSPKTPNMFKILWFLLLQQILYVAPWYIKMTNSHLVLSLLQNHVAQASFQVEAFGKTFVLDVELNQWVSTSRVLSSEMHWKNAVCVCYWSVWGMTNTHQIYLQRVLCCFWWTAWS